MNEIANAGQTIEQVWLCKDYNMICVKRSDKFAYQVIDLDDWRITSRTEAPGIAWVKLGIPTNQVDNNSSTNQNAPGSSTQ